MGYSREAGLGPSTFGFNRKFPVNFALHNKLCQDKVMYIVAIGWLFVVLMLALAEGSAVGGALTFLLYGLAPLALFLWLAGTPQRRRLARKTLYGEVSELDRGDAKPDQ